MKSSFFHKTTQDKALLFSFFAFLFSFGFLFYRSHFGVDFFDEPYYAALALRLVLGQKLFVDELYLAQTFSVLTFPLLQLYYSVTQSLEGILLFMRLMNATLYLVLGGLVFILFQKRSSKSIALLAGASCALFFPGNMTSLGYNTLGTAFLTIALLFSFVAVEKNKNSVMVLAGFFMGLACISYITFCAMALIYCLYLFSFKSQRKLSYPFALGVSLALVAPIIFIFLHWSHFLESLAFGKEYFHQAPSLIQLFEVIHKFFPKTVLLLSFTFWGAAYYSHKKNSRIFSWLLATVPLISAWSCNLAFVSWSGYPFYLPFFSLIAFYRLNKSAFSIALLKWVFLPSMVAGMITAGTSASGFFNAQVGLLPAVVSALLFLGLALCPFKEKSSWIHLAPLSFPVFLLLLYPLNVWSDSDFKSLTQKVNAGPYRGLYTAPEKKQIAEQSFKILKPLLNTTGPLLIYPNGPSGYLIQPVPPAKGVTWYQNSGNTNRILANLYKTQINPQSRVIRMKVWYGTPTVKSFHKFEPGDALNDLIESTHHAVQDTDWFTLFAPNVTSPKS